jgi:hypothetical protein
VGLTALCMHNGMLETLEKVLPFYDRGRSENPNVANRRRRGDDGIRVAGRLSGQFRGVDDMSEREKEDIVASLDSCPPRPMHVRGAPRNPDPVEILVSELDEHQLHPTVREAGRQTHQIAAPGACLLDPASAVPR